MSSKTRLSLIKIAHRAARFSLVTLCAPIIVFVTAHCRRCNCPPRVITTTGSRSSPLSDPRPPPSALRPPSTSSHSLACDSDYSACGHRRVISAINYAARSVDERARWLADTFRGCWMAQVYASPTILRQSRAVRRALMFAPATVYDCVYTDARTHARTHAVSSTVGTSWIIRRHHCGHTTPSTHDAVSGRMISFLRRAIVDVYAWFHKCNKYINVRCVSNGAMMLPLAQRTLLSAIRWNNRCTE